MTAWSFSPRDRMAGIMDTLADLRLPPTDVLELRYYFNAYEADIGIHSLHYAQFDAMLGFQNTGAVLWEPQVEPRACEARRRGNKVYRVLARMIDAGASSSVTVLHRVYGPRCPHARYDEFRDLAPIAAYTPVVEALAERMTRTLRMSVLTRTMGTLGNIDELAKARVCDGVRERVSPEQALGAKLEKRPRAGARSDALKRTSPQLPSGEVATCPSPERRRLRYDAARDDLVRSMVPFDGDATCCGCPPARFAASHSSEGSQLLQQRTDLLRMPLRPTARSVPARKKVSGDPAKRATSCAKCLCVVRCTLFGVAWFERFPVTGYPVSQGNRTHAKAVRLLDRKRRLRACADERAFVGGSRIENRAKEVVGRALTVRHAIGGHDAGATSGDGLFDRDSDGYVAQRYAAPGERAIDVEDPVRMLKFDLRAYVYDGLVQWTAARVYQGQTTNFRTPGGGFAPVLTVPRIEER